MAGGQDICKEKDTVQLAKEPDHKCFLSTRLRSQNFLTTTGNKTSERSETE